MSGYESYAAFYDATQVGRAEHADYIRSLIEKHHPKARRVLELACGTGSVLERLREHYEVTGVDLSEEMLARAAEKLPSVRLVRADMTSVDLGEAFDAVLCVYDSINHLLRFEQWEQVFDRALAHLTDRGVFVFDVNTERKLASFAGPRLWADWFGDGNLMVSNVSDDGGGVYTWHIRVFERADGDEYRLHADDIPEVAFPRERIVESLKQRFSRVWTYDAQRSRPTTRSERLHFVCRR